MKVLFIVRSTLFSVKGGDTTQVEQTAAALRKLGVEVDIMRATENIQYSRYSLLHFFNITRPADMLLHIKKSGLPYVVSTIYVDYANPAARQTSGIKNRLLNLFSSDGQEYIKAVAKSILKGEKLVSRNYMWIGHKRSVQWILKNAAGLLPNSKSEYNRLVASYGIEKKYTVIPNAADRKIFNYNTEEIMMKDRNTVLCVAQVELRKNQLNLIKALNDTGFQLYLIGNPAPNHTAYYNECKRISSSNIHFVNAITQNELVYYYKKAKVHVLPSWFETTGLASLEALFCGCNIVVTDYGDTPEYFDKKDFGYCDPASVTSIRQAVENAAASETNVQLINEAMDKYNWQKAAEKTFSVYKKYIAQ